MKVKQIASVIREIVPLGLALDWDNVGLLVGDNEQDVSKVLVTIDITKDVLDEAKRFGAEMILSYHPIIWNALKTVTAQGPGAMVYELIKSGISVFAIHTALDLASDGVNDGLAEMVGIENGRPIGDFVDDPREDNYKLLVFVPVDAAAKVAQAIFKAGAGAIGNYSNCGFSTEGTGTFIPLEGAKPAIGQKGKFEKVEETRFETIVHAAKLRAAVEAMKNAHPYEVPAYDIIKLHPSKERPGLGRMGLLEQPATVSEIVDRIKTATDAKFLGIVGKKERTVQKAAVAAGSCGEIINSVISAGCDLYVTGELKHHQAIAAQEAGLTCLCLSHTVSERFMLKTLVSRLEKNLKSVKIKVSKKDADPFTWKEL